MEAEVLKAYRKRWQIANFFKFDAQGKIVKHVDYVISMPATPA